MKRARAEAAPPSATGAGSEGSGKKPKKLDAKDQKGTRQVETMATFKGYSLDGIPSEAHPQGDKPNKGAHGYTLRAKNGAVPSKHVTSNNPSVLRFLVRFPNQSPLNRSKWKPLFDSITFASLC